MPGWIKKEIAGLTPLRAPDSPEEELALEVLQRRRKRGGTPEAQREERIMRSPGGSAFMERVSRIGW
jgi:hypothetical protein